MPTTQTTIDRLTNCLASNNAIKSLMVMFFICFSLNCFAVTSINELKQQQQHEILFNIHAYYVEDLSLQSSFSDKRQFEALLNQLDPYSKYLDENELDALFNSTNGRYTGLGIEVQAKDDQIVIINALNNSPAHSAGIKQNDVLLAINNQSVANKNISQVANMILKSESATVQLSIKRNNILQPLRFALTRREINIESVKSALYDFGVGYMAINSFSNHTLHDVSRQLAQLESNYGGALAGLVLDLRDNPGGTLQSAVAVADLFLQQGTIVTTKGRFYDANQHYKASAGDILNGSPIVVLINENSASAAEILAAALKDNQRATLVGNKSFGKGSVQSLIPLGNGNTALKLTTAKYFSPSGKSIDGIGVAPDVAINKSTLSQINKVAIIKTEQGNSNGSWFSENPTDQQLLKAKQLLTMK